MINDIKKYQNVFRTKDGLEIIFRIPKTSDLETLLKFVNKLADEDTFISIRKRKTKKEEIGYLKKISQALKEKKGLTITAFYQDQAVANGEVNKRGERQEHVGHLGISVGNGFRDKGIGQELMKELLCLTKELLRVKLVTLEVFSNNQQAIHLYKKLGFKECGCVPGAINYKNELVDNIIMYLDLDPISQ